MSLIKLILILITLFYIKLSQADQINIIRDAEIENLLKDISKILVQETELEKDNLKFFIDNKKYINALVTPDRKFFFTTELLLKSRGVDDLAGVISHEIGHIIGGHFQKRQMAMEKSSTLNILSSILGIGAIVGGAHDAGSAILMGGQQLSGAKLLAFSRSQESLADQTAIRLLKRNGFSLQGLINVFEEIKRNEKIKKVNPYLLTHPLSTERIRNIKLNFDNQKLIQYQGLNYRFKLAKAKLNGFFLNNSQIEVIYPDKNRIESLYAQALNNYRIGKLNKAIFFVEKCSEIDEFNPYFYELKGQILFESGSFEEAINSFLKAKEILPNELGFELFLAKSFYHSGNKRNQERSVDLLLSYIKKDEFPVDAWHYLGLNYGKLKMIDYSSYAFAEKYLLINKIDNAKLHINRAKKITKDPILLKKLSDLEYEIKKRK